MKTIYVGNIPLKLVKLTIPELFAAWQISNRKNNDSFIFHQNAENQPTSCTILKVTYAK